MVLRQQAGRTNFLQAAQQQAESVAGVVDTKAKDIPGAVFQLLAGADFISAISLRRPSETRCIRARR